MLATQPIVNEPFVLTKCDYFVDVQLWPLTQQCNPRGWLTNFEDAEQIYAVHLLNSFMFFRQVLIDPLYSAAFQGISRQLCGAQAFLTAQANWRSFVDLVLITRVTGETPSDTDSGYLFARLARQLLDVPEDRILSPSECLESLMLSPRPVVFVDDIAGSGDQFIATWNRAIALPSNTVMSFSKLASIRHRADFYYCPLFCTQKAAARITNACPNLILAPAHVLPARYSAVAADSVLWPISLRDEGIAFVERASKRAGIPISDWRGYDDLGLTIAFEHFAVPDATLPLFWWEENGWIPLVPRR
ncbi:MAG: phosphoribosyltransferase-like protein [Thermoanaerobaculia bacterium]